MVSIPCYRVTDQGSRKTQVFIPSGPPAIGWTWVLPGSPPSRSHQKLLRDQELKGQAWNTYSACYQWHLRWDKIMFQEWFSKTFWMLVYYGCCLHSSFILSFTRLYFSLPSLCPTTSIHPVSKLKSKK
jgi:hypothetical protein